MNFKIASPLLLTALAATTALLFTSAKPDKGNIDAEIQTALDSIPKEAIKAPKKERKILVFSATNGYHHPSIPVGNKMMELLGETSQAFTAVVSNDLSNFEPEAIKQFDAICFLNTTREVFLPKKYKFLDNAQKAEANEISDRLKASFSAHLKSGAGFIGIHSATDTFQQWPEYGEMIGGYFDGHPWNANDDVSIKVEPGAEAHPLVAHLNGEPLNFKEEIYQLRAPYSSKDYTMLLRLDPEKSSVPKKGIKRDDKDFGVAWIKKHGEGRVFYCSLGHNNHIFTNPKVLQHYLAGIQYALGDLALEEVPAH